MRIPARLQRAAAIAAVLVGFGAFGASLSGLSSVGDDLRAAGLEQQPTGTATRVSYAPAAAAAPALAATDRRCDRAF